MQVVLHHLVPERRTGDLGALEQICRLVQGLRQPRLSRGLVRVAGVLVLELQRVIDPVEAGGDDRREGQVGVAVGAGRAVLEPQALAVADQAQGAGAVVGAVPEVGENRNWVSNPPAEIDVPLVYLTMAPRDDLSIVSVDNYLGGQMAMSHLMEQGYRKIGHISGPLDWWEARQRMAAWKDALTEARL